MKSAPLLTVAFGLIACTNLRSDISTCNKDSSTVTNLVKTISKPPVVNSPKPVENAGPELPFYKDVLDSKRLFW